MSEAKTALHVVEEIANPWKWPDTRDCPAIRDYLAAIPADAPEQIAALQAEIAELKGMTAYARTSEAAKQSVEYWREMATLAEEEGKMVKAELARVTEERDEASAAKEYWRKQETSQSLALIGVLQRADKAEADLAAYRKSRKGDRS